MIAGCHVAGGALRGFRRSSRRHRPFHLPQQRSKSTPSDPFGQRVNSPSYVTLCISLRSWRAAVSLCALRRIPVA
jgi:hypothetical protein